jgi:hypothetical protein
MCWMCLCDYDFLPSLSLGVVICFLVHVIDKPLSRRVQSQGIESGICCWLSDTEHTLLLVLFPPSTIIQSELRIHSSVIWRVDNGAHQNPQFRRDRVSHHHSNQFSSMNITLSNSGRGGPWHHVTSSYRNLRKMSSVWCLCHTAL